MAKLFGELCPACGGDGRKGMYEGVGPHGLDCPYCFAFREMYVVGQVPSHATTLPNEHTGERWFHVFDRQTRAPTDQRRKAFSIVEKPHAVYGPIERPRRRTLPMRGPVGVVRHWTTNTLLPRFKTGPVTKQHRYHQQVEFVKAYDILKADQRRRELWKWRITFAVWIMVALIMLAIVVVLFIIIFASLRLRIQQGG